MFKKAVLGITVGLILMGCSADVEVNTLKSSGGPIGNAVVEFLDDGGNVVAKNGTDPGGTLLVNLEYGSYKIKANKASKTNDDGTVTKYEEAYGNLRVDMIGALFGINIDIPISETRTTATTK